jgi:hypothetical protein
MMSDTLLKVLDFKVIINAVILVKFNDIYYYLFKTYHYIKFAINNI